MNSVMDVPALSVERLSHSYGKRKALDNVSFSFPSATFVALLGLNGAGKSTLLSLVTRLYAARTGHIRIFGHDVERQSGAALRTSGIVFQQRTLDLDLSVRQNLTYHGALHGMDRHEARGRTSELLAQLGLEGRSDDKVRDLSGGQMRQVEIARALLHRPRLLILDEPTAGLDIKARADILQHVRSLVKENGVAVLWATHLVDEVANEDDLVVLHRGRILAQGRVSDVVGTDAVGHAFAHLTQAADLSSEAA